MPLLSFIMWHYTRNYLQPLQSGMHISCTLINMSLLLTMKPTNVFYLHKEILNGGRSINGMSMKFLATKLKAFISVLLNQFQMNRAFPVSFTMNSNAQIWLAFLICTFVMALVTAQMEKMRLNINANVLKGQAKISFAGRFAMKMTVIVHYFTSNVKIGIAYFIYSSAMVNKIADMVKMNYVEIIFLTLSTLPYPL